MKIIKHKRITIRHSEASVEFTTGRIGNLQRCPHCHELLSTVAIEETNAHSDAAIDAETIKCPATPILKLKDQRPK